MSWPSFERQDLACGTMVRCSDLNDLCLLSSNTPGPSKEEHLDSVRSLESFRKYQGRSERWNDADESFALFNIRCSCCIEALSSYFGWSHWAAACWPISKERYLAHRLLTQGGTVSRKEERSEGASRQFVFWLISELSVKQWTNSVPGTERNFTHTPSKLPSTSLSR